MRHPLVPNPLRSETQYRRYYHFDLERLCKLGEVERRTVVQRGNARVILTPKGLKPSLM